jgi:S-(hydroxymethyl)glutathione dehydrogenase/alcohol dehydrogenase
MRGIVYEGGKAEVRDGLDVRPPGPRDVIVEVKAAGVCHSDLSVLDGTIPWPTPAVLGHEGAGVVAEVGAAVTHVAPGDHVVMATLAACGLCRFCADGRPTLCRATMGSLPRPFRLDGDPCYSFAATSAFAERTVVTAEQVVPIPRDVPLTSAALVGCAVVTGVGAVLNRARLRRGDTAVVYGCGGVGLNAIQGCRIAGARRIVAIDVEPAKEDLARRFGATDFLDGNDPDIVARVRALVPHSADRVDGPMNAGGVDWVFDVVAHPAVTANALEMLTWGGNVVVLGVPPPATELTVPYSRLTHVDRGILGCRYGTISPQRDIPLLIDLYRRGELLLDELVSATHPLDRFAEVVDAMHGGTLARAVLTLD